jgi:hypothetical protein
LGTFSSQVNWHTTDNSVDAGDCGASAAVAGCDLTISYLPFTKFGTSASIGAQFTLKKIVLNTVVSTTSGYHRWNLSGTGGATCDDTTVKAVKL